MAESWPAFILCAFFAGVAVAGAVSLEAGPCPVVALGCFVFLALAFGLIGFLTTFEVHRRV